MQNTIDIWIIDDDDSIRWVLETAFKKQKYSTHCFESADDALDELCHTQPKAIISDIRMPGTDGLNFIEKVHKEHPKIPVIIMTAHSDLDSAVSSYQKGAFDYLPKPFDVNEATAMLERALALHKEAAQEEQKDEQKEAAKLGGIIGEAPAMQNVFRAIGKLSQSSINVLINGESGTGKELVAKALHEHSSRSDNPFIAINVAAIPKDLIEAELFGYEKGAFTGANKMHTGRFEQANGGTLFLDEIGDMPADAQTRLLRVLSTGEFYRIGGGQPINVDVRIIAATHQNLQKLVDIGKFREDLFHRLNVIRIQLPSLNERREDIPLLAEFFLQNVAQELQVEQKQLETATQEYLCQLDWPGNVRQLENVCRWLTVMAPGNNISIADLPPELIEHSESTDTVPTNKAQTWSEQLQRWSHSRLQKNHSNVAIEAQKIMEQTLIRAALEHTKGKRAEAAKLLGWGRNTLTRKIQELKLDV